MEYQITGTISFIGEVAQISEKFKKRDVYLTIDENSQYPSKISLQIIQDKVSILDNYKIGDEVKINYSLRGNEYEKDGKKNVFNTLTAWKIELLKRNDIHRTAQNVPQNEVPQTTYNPNYNQNEPPFKTDDIPF